LVAGLAGFCQKVEKTVFFRGKNRTGKNSFCRQKPIFARIVIKVNKLLLYYVFFCVLILSQYVFCTIICGNPLLTHRYSLVVNQSINHLFENTGSNNNMK